MKVELIDPNRNILRTAYTACRTCYSEETPSEIWRKVDVSEKSMLKTIDKVISSGHGSVLEHINFTFLIEGVSRTLTHQLVRHRVGTAFSQQSQRYVKFEEAKFRTPPSVTKAKVRHTLKAVQGAKDTYDFLTEEVGIPPEDARFYLLEGTMTNLVFTVNLRQLIHMMGLRLCILAQWEIRRLHSLMRKEVVYVTPWLKKYMMPKCVPLGYCDEERNKDEHCKVRPHRDTVMKAYERNEDASI